MFEYSIQLDYNQNNRKFPPFLRVRFKFLTMSIWSKIVGGGIGYAIGGPIGALVGVVGGHVVDTAIDQNNDKSVAFTIAVIALGAKMAKADGTVSRAEIDAFKRVFIIQDDDLKNVARVFDLAKQDTAGYDIYARQVQGLFTDSPMVLENLLWCLSHIARADGAVHKNELAFLQDVSRIFGFSLDDFERITGMRADGSNASPYEILGVSKDASDDEILAVYKNLIRQYHPDRLMAQGIPVEMIKGAEDKMAEINVAMQAIKKQRSKQGGA